MAPAALPTITLQRNITFGEVDIPDGAPQKVSISATSDDAGEFLIAGGNQDFTIMLTAEGTPCYRNDTSEQEAGISFSAFSGRIRGT